MRAEQGGIRLFLLGENGPRGLTIGQIFIIQHYVLYRDARSEMEKEDDLRGEERRLLASNDEEAA